MEFCVNAAELRKALAAIEKAEANGFMYCLAVMKLRQAGYGLDECQAGYDSLIERAHPTAGSLNWGRFQGVSERHKFVNGKLVPLNVKASHRQAKRS